jgi:hypothetical protein
MKRISALGIYACACKHIDIGAIGSGTGGFDRKFIRRDADQYGPGYNSNRGFRVPAFDNEHRHHLHRAEVFQRAHPISSEEFRSTRISVFRSIH